VTGLVMSFEFSKKQEFNLKKIKRPIYKKYGWNIQQGEANKNIVKVNIFYKRYRKRTEIDIIRE